MRDSFECSGQERSRYYAKLAIGWRRDELREDYGV